MQEENVIRLFDPEFGYIEYQIKEFTGYKEYTKFINNVKRIVRSSFEYKEWIHFIKETKGSYCYFTDEIGKEVTIEIHHHPYTMEDLVNIVIEDKLSKGERFASFDIAKEVMELHFKNFVGYIPLIKTLHEKYHNGFLDIPINLVEGEWRKLSNIYNIPLNIAAKVEKLSKITADSDIYNWSRDKYILDKNQKVG